MAAAARQMVGSSGSGMSSLAITITSSLAGSILVASTVAGSLNVNCNLPTDSGSQTWTNAAAQVNASGHSNQQRIDHVLNTASGITTVTVHTSDSGSMAGMTADAPPTRTT